MPGSGAPFPIGLWRNQLCKLCMIKETEEKGLESRGRSDLICFVKLKKISLVAQTVKRLSTMQETWVPSLGWEDPLEKQIAIHSSTIAWKIPWMEEPHRLQSMGS